VCHGAVRWSPTHFSSLGKIEAAFGSTFTPLDIENAHFLQRYICKKYLKIYYVSTLNGRQ